MDNSEFLIVHKSILPPQFEAIIEVREMIKDGNVSVSEACKRMGISRSSFYKYKDYVFRVRKDQGSRAILTLKTVDRKGILSGILGKVSELGANVISINQDTPLGGLAYIALTIDLGDVEYSREALSKAFSGIEGVKKVDIIGVE